MVATALVALMASAAQGAVLWMGLPAGGSIAFSTVNGQVPWERMAFADLPDVGSQAMPALGDLDGDGDADAIVGTGDGTLAAFENVGTAAAPAWRRRTDWQPALDVGSASAPALGDLDGDGDLDLLVGGTGGSIVGVQRTATGWEMQPAWNVAVAGTRARPGLGRLDGDGALDLVVGTETGDVLAFLGTGNPAAPFVRAAGFDTATGELRAAPALGDLDGDGRAELLVSDGGARSVVLARDGDAWVLRAGLAPADPGSGPAGPALVAGELDPSAPPPSGGGGGTGAPTVRLETSAKQGPAPLRVTFDASGSAAGGATLSYAWDFGDGTGSAPSDGGGNSGGGGGGGESGGRTTSEAAALIKTAPAAYAEARRARDADRNEEAVAAYRALAQELTTIAEVHEDGPLSRKGTRDIGRVARWYLQKVAHDVGGIYLWNDVGTTTGCERYAASLQWSRESANQAKAGGFPQLPALNGTNGNIRRATIKLQKGGCTVPQPISPLAAGLARAAAPTGEAVVEHEYVTPGVYTARVTVTAAGRSTTAETTITVADDAVPPPPGGPSDPETDAVEGFGATTPGGAGGRVVEVSTPTEEAVRQAFEAARAGGTIVRFATTEPITITRSLPQLTGAFVTIEGNGATLVGAPGSNPNIVDVRGHDVIVRNLRIRNGSDNLRVQGEGAYNVVVSHVSSTGADDDGISVGYGAHDVTVQWSFLAGNTRSIFMKYGSTTNVSLHHVWVMKQWVRGPLVSGGILADIRNVIVEDWTLWGTRFEDGSSGNVVQSLFNLGTYARGQGGKADSALRLGEPGQVFTAGNVYGGTAEASDQGSATAPYDAPAVTTWPVSEMAPKVRGRAGCLPRDGFDQAYIERTDGWDVTESTPLRLGTAG